MIRLKFRFLAIAGSILAVAAILPVRAQDADDMKRAVARISLMDGQVSVQRGDADWVAGIVNAPLMADDRIATGPNSRAEVQFDASHLVRIGGNAEIHLTQLEYGHFQLELAKGTVTYRVLRASGANAEVDTPTVSVRPSRIGAYRISVSEAGDTEVTARMGSVEVFTPKGSQWISSGQTMMARGTVSDPEFQIAGSIPMDEWDRWNESRDRYFQQPSASAQYIDPANSGIYGAEDLDAAGTWTTAPDYGPVWHPTAVPVGWAPYSNGRWVWSDWYGWTWVDYDSWGWAPFHYGRWFDYPGVGWCWYPGVRGVRHFWSPALVGFFGYGGGIGFGFGFGNVGWVALAPYEVFHPWWGRGFYGRHDFYRNVNITNINITNVYRNSRVRNGVSGMAAGDFQSGRFNSVARLSGAQVGRAGMVRGQVPLAPSTANLHFSDRQASFTPRGAANNRFFTHQQPAGAQRIPFSQQQIAGIRANQPAAGRTFGSGGSPAVGATRQPAGMENNTRPGGGGNGWRRFGEPGGSSVTPQASPRNEANTFRGGNAPAATPQNARPQGSSGWQRFGNPGSAPQASAPRNNAPAYEAPRNNPPAYSAPRGNQPAYNPPPRYEGPRSNQGPAYSAPRSPNYSAPRSNGPSYSAPRSNPAPSYSAPQRGNGGGGGGRPSGGRPGGGRSR